MKRLMILALALCTYTALVHAGEQPEASLSGNSILVEAESFADKGGWSVDQQFMDQMGSPYLLAHGMGKPVADAVTTVEIPQAGEWLIYARTYNWTSPWTGNPGPGKFRIKIGGKTVKNILGSEGDRWGWQYAGSIRLKAGETTLALTDLMRQARHPWIYSGQPAWKRLQKKPMRPRLTLWSSAAEWQECALQWPQPDLAAM